MEQGRNERECLDRLERILETYPILKQNFGIQVPQIGMLKDGNKCHGCPSYLKLNGDYCLSQTVLFYYDEEKRYYEALANMDVFNNLEAYFKEENNIGNEE